MIKTVMAAERSTMSSLYDEFCTNSSAKASVRTSLSIAEYMVYFSLLHTLPTGRLGDVLCSQKWLSVSGRHFSSGSFAAQFPCVKAYCRV